MSISAISELGAGNGASASTAASTSSAQSPAQRIGALQAQQAAIDAQIASTKVDKKLTCSEIDSKVGSLKTQRAQVDSQLQRVESQQRQPAGSAQATGSAQAAGSAQATSSVQAAGSVAPPTTTQVTRGQPAGSAASTRVQGSARAPSVADAHTADAQRTVEDPPPAANFELGSSPGYRSLIHVIA